MSKGQLTDSERERLEDLLRETGVSWPVEQEPHPSPWVISSYVAKELDEETAGHVRVHLLHCEACLDEVVGLEAAQKPASLIQFAIAILKGLVPPPVVAQPLAVAAAGEKGTARTWECHEEGDVRVGVSVSAAEDLIVNVERAGKPAQDATVVMERTGSEGEPIEYVRGQTDQRGEITLGPLSRFPSPAAGEEYRVTVRFAEPSEE
jgi:hypothetical protein